ncbi:MAG: amino acid adenylation domain-containing protein [Crocinitomix sp.]|nr:amino acid adenylation domain-containing protein [Crocinitomix sp.]
MESKLSDTSQLTLPETATEKALAEIWKEVLDQENIGRNSHFFRLGGNSIKLIKLRARILSNFGFAFDLQELFTINVLSQQSEKIESSTTKEEYHKIAKANLSEDYAVSSSQKSLWILSKMGGASAAYNMPRLLRLESGFDLNRLNASINKLVKRHEILRTVFVLKEGEIRQRILNDLSIELKELDLGATNYLTPSNYMEQDANVLFDIENGPLIRTSVLKTQENECFLYFNLHHIISDERSMNILLNEVLALYQNADLPDLQIQYKDYAEWEQEKLTEDGFSKAKAYWLEKMSGELPVLNLPIANKRPITQTINGSVFNLDLSPELFGKVKAHYTKEDATLFVSVLATWTLFFSRYSAQKDIIIGTPISGRDREELEDQIGLYMKTIPLRNTVQPEDSFETSFRKIKEGTFENLSNGAYPLEALVEDLNQKTEPNRNPLFDVLINIADKAVQSAEHLGVNYQEGIRDGGICPAKFDFEIKCQEQQDYLGLSIVYNTDIYPKAAVQKMIAHYVLFLEQLLDKPKLSYQCHNYLNLDEIKELTETFNPIYESRTAGESIIDLFQNHVKQTPNKLALVFGEKEWTYGQLDKISDQLAGYLQVKFDIQPNDLVGLKLDRSEWLIISILAIIKSGGGYVPIAVNYPKERIEYIHDKSDLKASISVEVIADFENDLNPYLLSPVVLDEKNTVYSIFTSGSTGKPKGVIITHGNLLSFINNFPERFGFNKVNRFAATTNFTFDISVIELLGVLTQGITIDLFSSLEISNPKHVIERIKKNGINGLQITPSRCTQLLMVSDEFLDGLNVLLIGGEAVNVDLYETLKKVAVYAVQVYGPTETTIWSTAMLISDSVQLNIGKPLASEKIFILNDHLQMEPKGTIGEICIGGEGVSKGYMKQDELTVERFVNSPFLDRERIYRTGDLGKWDDAGNLIFLGREDDQVKIRGYRIELAEIESQLSTIAGVEEAIVLAEGINGEDKILCAYIVLSNTFTASELRELLARKLPGYMVPQRYFVVEKMPLNSSGKIDRKTLRSIDKVELERDQEYFPPMTTEEIVLAKIWEEILDVEQVGLRDDFYGLGGDSLKSIRVIEKLNLANFEIQMEAILNEPLLENLAKQMIPISAKPTFSIDDQATPIEKTEKKRIISYNQKYLLLDNRSSGTFGPLVIEGLKRKKIESELIKFLSKFPSLTEAIIKTDKEWYAEYTPLKIRFFKEKLRAGDSLMSKISDQNHKFNQTFEMQKSEWIRVLILKDEQTNQNLVFCKIHHVLTDDFSNKLLMQAMKDYFEGLTTTFEFSTNAIHAKAQELYLRTNKARSEREFWKQELTAFDASPAPIQENDKAWMRNKTQLVLKGAELENFKELAKSLKLPAIALHLALHQQLITKKCQGNQLIQGVLTDLRSEKMQGLALSNVVGLVSNVFPIGIEENTSNLSNEVVHEVYDKYLKSRSSQLIPWEIIKNDYEELNKKPLEISGVFNHQVRPGNVPEINNNNVNVSSVVAVFSPNLDYTCITYNNGISLDINYDSPLNSQINMNEIFRELIQNLLEQKGQLSTIS